MQVVRCMGRDEFNSSQRKLVRGRRVLHLADSTERHVAFERRDTTIPLFIRGSALVDGGAVANRLDIS